MRRENPDKPFGWERKPKHEGQNVTAAPPKEEPSVMRPIANPPLELPTEPPDGEPILHG